MGLRMKIPKLLKGKELGRLVENLVFQVSIHGAYTMNIERQMKRFAKGSKRYPQVGDRVVLIGGRFDGEKGKVVRATGLGAFQVVLDKGESYRFHYTQLRRMVVEKVHQLFNNSVDFRKKG